MFKLTENMRAHQEEKEFAKWLLKLGNGELKSESSDASDQSIDIPDMC